MNVLVTGGSGFIGKAVVARLEQEGFCTKVFDRSVGDDIRIHRHAVRAVEGMDAVIHLAGILGTDELFDDVHRAIEVNITGTVNILDGCVEHGAKYIGITMLPVFPSIYTATKVSAGRFATAYHHNHGVPVSHVRAFNVFGSEQAHGHGHPRKIIPAFSVEGWNNEPMLIWGDGEQMVDLISVDEVARVFLAALHTPGRDETIDAGTGRGWTVNEVADFVLDITGSTAGVKHMPMRRGEIPTRVVAKGEGWLQHLSRPPALDKLDLVKAIVAYRNWS
jgi:UDP-glucose 4-epimerase